MAIALVARARAGPRRRRGVAVSETFLLAHNPDLLRASPFAGLWFFLGP